MLKNENDSLKSKDFRNFISVLHYLNIGNVFSAFLIPFLQIYGYFSPFKFFKRSLVTENLYNKFYLDFTLVSESSKICLQLSTNF